MILLTFCAFLLFRVSSGQPPEDKISFTSTDSNGHHRYTPSQCCQFCAMGEEYRHFVYSDGRCFHYPNSSSSVTALDISPIEEQNSPHVHRSTCCWFCGDSPDEYSYKKIESGGHCESAKLSDASPTTKCVLCEGIVVIIKELIDSQKDAVKDQVKVFCDQTVVLRRWCRKMVDDHLESIVHFIEEKIGLTEVCWRFVKACDAPEFATLTAPSRGSILDPRIDGAPLAPEEIIALPEITKHNLGNFLKLENLTPELRLENLKFLCRYGLIYNTYPCKACGGGASLIRQASMLDNFVWRCSECKATQQKFVKSSVRTGSFFFGLKKSFGVILLTAATFVQDPTQSLESITQEVVLERPTLIQYENFFLDVVQLIVTGKSSHLIGGAGKIIDVERSILYLKKYKDSNENRDFHHCLILFERGSSNYAVVEVTGYDSIILSDAIARHVRDGSKIASTEFGTLGGVAAVQAVFDGRHPAKTHLFYDFDAVPVRSIEANKWNTLKEAYKEAAKKNRQVAGLMLLYAMTRTSVKPVNTFMYGLSLYDPDDSSL